MIVDMFNIVGFHVPKIIGNICELPTVAEMFNNVDIHVPEIIGDYGRYCQSSHTKLKGDATWTRNRLFDIRNRIYFRRSHIWYLLGFLSSILLRQKDNPSESMQLSFLYSYALVNYVKS